MTFGRDGWAFSGLKMTARRQMGSNGFVSFAFALPSLWHPFLGCLDPQLHRCMDMGYGISMGFPDGDPCIHRCRMQDAIVVPLCFGSHLLLVKQRHFRQQPILRPVPVKMIRIVESEKCKSNSCLVVALGYFVVNLRFLLWKYCCGLMFFSCYSVVPINCLASSISNTVDKQLLDFRINLFWWFFFAIEIASLFNAVFIFLGSATSAECGHEDSWTEPKHGIWPRAEWDGLYMFILEHSGKSYEHGWFGRGLF